MRVHEDFLTSTTMPSCSSSCSQRHTIATKAMIHREPKSKMSHGVTSKPTRLNFI